MQTTEQKSGHTPELARFVTERHAGYHESAGPYEGGRIGFSIGERVFWTDAYCFPGTGQAAHDASVVFAKDIVFRWNVHALAPSPIWEAAKKALNFIENTESELGITLECGDALRAALDKAEGR